MTLRNYFETKYIVFRSLTDGSADGIRRSINQFSIWLGSEPRLVDLCDETVSKWVKHLEVNYAPKTVHNKRGDVLGVWLDAFFWDRSGTVQRPGRIRTIHVPDPEPDSWTAAEVAALALAARTVHGAFRFGPPRSKFLEATIRTAWETGLRRGDLWALRFEQIAPDGTIQKRQGKTGIVVCGRIEPDTFELLLSLGRDPPLAWPLDPSALGYWMIRLRRLAGLGNRGQFQRIRASAGTDVAIHQPGMETRFLGHTSPKADKWYIDKKRLPRSAISPVRLSLPKPRPPGIG